jgi:sigma-54-dependent transcriptional regulator
MNGQFGDPLIAAEELIKITTSLSTERNLHHLLNMILTSARKITHADAGRIYILDCTKRYLYVEVCQNDSIGALPKEASPIPLFINDKRNTANVCVYSTFYGKLINLPDIYQYTGFDFRETYTVDKLLGYQTQSILVVPLRSHQGITLGILELSNCLDRLTRQVLPFPQALQGIVAAFASQAAVAIDNVQLFSQNRQLIELLNSINQALEQENRQLRHTIERQSRFSEIIGHSPRMQQVYTFMEKILDSDATVLLRGETGTGKELVARAIHANSRRRKGEFVAQNCAALPENLLESELFGYRRGAFTGATTDKKGLIEVAHGGTLFLDEIGDMPLGMQAKLLRVLQEREVRPLGSVKSNTVDIRVIAATHCDLQEKVAAGEFREDLYYRLCVFPIDIPPLRERKEDLPALLSHFLKTYAEQYQKPIAGFSPDALDRLLIYDYPGNIREVKNLVERAVLLCDAGGSILPEHLPAHVMHKDHIDSFSPITDKKNTRSTGYGEGRDSLVELVKYFESSLIEQKLKECNWDRAKAARALKVPLRTLTEKIHRFKIKKQLSTTDPQR